MDTHDDELSPEERAALAALPRERRPSDLLEERTVRRLRQHRLLASPAAGWPTLTPLRAAVAAAAVVVLTLGSFVLGQWSGSRQTAEAMLAMHQHDTLLVAREVQRAGTAYLAALEALAGSETGDPEALDQGREVALATLHAAANQVASLAPDDPLAGDLLRVMAERRRARQAVRDEAVRERVVWF